MTTTLTRAPQPTIQFWGHRVFADRRGYRVTGRVEFPYEVGGCAQVPIDYCSCRPGGSVDDVGQVKTVAKNSEKRPSSPAAVD